MGDARQAIGFYDQQLAIVREIGDRRGEGNSMGNSAQAHYSLGNRAEAITRANSALAIFESIESPYAAKVQTKLAEWHSGGGSDRAAD